MLNSPTKLSPLEEVLFRSWARAHGVENHDDPNNQFDHRGLYKQTNGQIMQPHVLQQMAAVHNKAMEPQEAGGDVVNPDPYMAAAEMHGNQLKAQGDQAKLRAQSELEDKKHGQKIQLEQMKLQHQAAEKDKDRQIKAQEAAQARQQAKEDAEMNRQQAARDMQQQRQFQLEDGHMQRQQQVEDAQMSQQHDLKSTLMQEQLARSRPQPEPKGAMGVGQTPAQGQGGPPGGQPPAAPTHAQPPQQGNGLQHQLMQRAMGPRQGF